LDKGGVNRRPEPRTAQGRRERLPVCAGAAACGQPD
jgi:hypothetical protein